MFTCCYTSENPFVPVCDSLHQVILHVIHLGNIVCQNYKGRQSKLTAYVLLSTSVINQKAAKQMQKMKLLSFIVITHDVRDCYP